MTAATTPTTNVYAPIRRPAYDPKNLSPLDEEDRKQDDMSEGIDWDEILATTQDDFLAGRFAYDSADYATEEAAEEALDALVNSVVEGVLRRVADPTPTPHAACG